MRERESVYAYNLSLTLMCVGEREKESVYVCICCTMQEVRVALQRQLTRTLCILDVCIPAVQLAAFDVMSW